MLDKTENVNPYLFALSCISGKWKMALLNHMNYYGFIRFSKTKKTFPVTEKVLSQQLKELIADGLVERIQYNEIPLRVEYRLTEAGRAIIPSIDLLYTWSIGRMKRLGITIDPDAFLVHPEDKYGQTLEYFVSHYDDIYEMIDYAAKNNLDFKEVISMFKKEI